jgi:hypothetical protein
MFSRRKFLEIAGTVLGWLGIHTRRGYRVKTSSPNEPVTPLTSGNQFPPGMEPFQWQRFQAESYPVPATGIVYRTKAVVTTPGWQRPRPASGMPLGAIDTGALYLESSGTFGYSSIFNNYCPPGGPVNTPYLGIGIGGHVWVLTTGQTKNFAGDNLPSFGPPLALESGPVHQAEEIEYWGHYPIVDMQYKLGAAKPLVQAVTVESERATVIPPKVGMRAWAPFMPGDSKTSNTPEAVFEIHITNPTSRQLVGTLAFSFPGFKNHRTRNEVLGDTNCSPYMPVEPRLPETRVVRREAPESLSGTWVEDKVWGMSYVLAVAEENKVRADGGLGTDRPSWGKIEKALPVIPSGNDDGSSSVAVDFSLEPHQEKVIRFILAWYAPEWDGHGNPGTGGNRYTRMYASRFTDAGQVAVFLARNLQPLLTRGLADGRLWRADDSRMAP